MPASLSHIKYNRHVKSSLPAISAFFIPCKKRQLPIMVGDIKSEVWWGAMFYLGIAGSIVLFAISGFHFYWLFGGTAGIDRNIQADKNGNRIAVSKPAMLAAALTFIVAAVLPLVAVGLISVPLPRWLIDAGLIFGIAVLAFRGLGGLVWSLAQSKPRDIFHRWNILLYTPICLFLAAAYLASYLVFNQS